jgi:hypothetical protein
VASVQPGAFDGLGNLRKLYLHTNQIGVLSAGVFRDLPNVKELDLSYNEIAVIEPGAFAGLGGLTSLDLTENRFSHLDAKAFDGLGSLVDLWLNYVELESMDPGAFRGMDSLMLLGLQGNSLLTDLDLEQAQFSNLSGFFIEDSTSVTRVSLRKAVLNQMSFNTLLTGGSDAALGIGLLPAVTTLDLSGIDFSAVTDLSSLWTMDGVIDLSLVGAKSLDAVQLDVLLDQLDAMQSPSVEGVLHLTQADYQTLNEAGEGLLAAWDAEPGHHVETLAPGDVDGDGFVDESDAAVLASHWGSHGMIWTDGDFNGDERVDVLDAAILAANWRTHEEETPVTPIPTPSLAVLVLILASGASVCRRRWFVR